VRNTDSLGFRGKDYIKMGLMAGIKVAASYFAMRIFLAYLCAFPTLEGVWAMQSIAFRSSILYSRSQFGHRASYLSCRCRCFGRKLYKRGLTMKGVASFVLDPGK